MSERFVTIDGSPTAEQALASWTALFGEPGEYVIAKAEPVSSPPEGDFESWFLRALYERTHEEFVTAQYAIWEVLDGLLRRRGVRAPSELDLWELNRALFDLTTASTARMVGLRVPTALLEELTGLGWSVPEALDFPALGYRMGLIYERLQQAKPVAWSELRSMAAAKPLTLAEHAAIDHMRRRGGIWLRPILDNAGNVWTAEREIAPLRRLASAALENRTSTQEAVRELGNSQRARGIVRDAERVIRTELAESRARGVWATITKGAAPDALFFRQVAGSPCRACLRLYMKPDGTPQLYRRDELERWSETVNTGPRETWTPKIGATHPNCLCAPWALYNPAYAALFEQFAPVNREQLARFGVHQGG